MPDSESGPWEFHPCASAQLFREVSLSCPAVVALSVVIRQWRPVVVARIKWSWRTASRLGWGRMYQMNEYKIVKVHGGDLTPYHFVWEFSVKMKRGHFYLSLAFPWTRGSCKCPLTYGAHETG